MKLLSLLFIIAISYVFQGCIAIHNPMSELVIFADSSNGLLNSTGEKVIFGQTAGINYFGADNLLDYAEQKITDGRDPELYFGGDNRFVGIYASRLSSNSDISFSGTIGVFSTGIDVTYSKLKPVYITSSIGIPGVYQSILQYKFLHRRKWGSSVGLYYKRAFVGIDVIEESSGAFNFKRGPDRMLEVRSFGLQLANYISIGAGKAGEQGFIYPIVQVGYSAELASVVLHLGLGARSSR